MPTTARQWLLNGHPRGRGIEDGDFKLAETQLPDPAASPSGTVYTIRLPEIPRKYVASEEWDLELLAVNQA